MSGEGARPTVRLSDAQRLDWLRLIRTEGVGPRTFRKLLNHFGGAGEALANLADLAHSRRVSVPRIATLAEAKREMEAAARLGIRYVATGEASYPTPLAAIDDAPPLLALRGHEAALAAPGVAIVGSRNASAAGQQMARTLATDLGRAGFAVVSGLARGIDARAHEASLDTGTVAVLAGGHDRVYPPEHEALLARILERGVAVSEMPMGWEPRGRDFPRRNRLVSGLSLGVVLVEAARRSGSLITARFALEQGRDVFAVPGSPLDPRAEGTNDLIRQGATLVTQADDVIAVLQPMIGQGGDSGSMREGAPPSSDDPLFDEVDYFADQPLQEGGLGSAPSVAARVILRDPVGAERPLGALPAGGDPASVVRGLIGPVPVSIDELVRVSGLHPREVHLALHELRTLGLPLTTGGALVSLAPDPLAPEPLASAPLAPERAPRP